MGVPSLYRWLTQKYPEIKKRLDLGVKYDVDNLYLDFNAIIHPCCDKTLSTSEETDSKLYNNLIDFMKEIVEKVNPKKLLYIAVDGVAPRAKLNQQRSRRFQSARDHDEEDKKYFEDDVGIDQNPAFDVNSITPGTAFMDRLDSFIQDFISYKLSTDRSCKFNVIYSNYKVPGEGEQKIMDYIRNCQPPEQKSMIFSPDGDVIFLGLTLFDYNILIVRAEPKNFAALQENQPANDEYSIININLLRKLLINEFKNLIKINFDYRRFLEDWILLCFSVGNDFLPSSPCFEIRTNALDKLTSILRRLYLRTKNYITDFGKINFAILQEFFDECSVNEDAYISEKRNNLYNTRQRMNIPFVYGKEFSVSDDKGKIRFYVEKMNIKCEDDLKIACEEYIKGWEWVYNYYFYDNISWDWYYPYHFAPFFADLSRIDLNGFKSMFNGYTGKPLSPMEQLLAVLPPNSKGLLPYPLRNVFEIHKDMYPMNFEIDMYQKCMSWEGKAILPFVNINNIKTSFGNIKDTLTFEECARNISSYPIFYSGQINQVGKIYNLYSNLNPYEIIEINGTSFKVYPIYKINLLNSNLVFNNVEYSCQVVKTSFDQRKPLKKNFKVPNKRN